MPEQPKPDQSPSKRIIDARRVTTPARIPAPRNPPPQPPQPQLPISPEDNPIVALQPETEEIPEDQIVHRSFRISKRVSDAFQTYFDRCHKDWTQNQCLEALLVRTGNLVPNPRIPGHSAPPRALFRTQPLYSDPVDRRQKR